MRRGRDGAKHGCVTFFFEHTDGLVRKGFAGAVEFFPSGQEGDKGGFGNGRADGFENALSGLEVSLS